MLNAVLFVSVLFFAGASQRFEILSRRRALLAVAIVLLGFGAANLVMLPKLW